MEVPLKFRVKNPLDGSGLDIDLEVGCYFMAAAGPLDEWLEPKEHTQSNTAVNMIAMGGMKSGGRGGEAGVEPSLFFVLVCIMFLI